MIVGEAKAHCFDKISNSSSRSCFDSEAQEPTAWLSLVSILFLIEQFEEALGMDDEDPSVIAANRVRTFLETAGFSEIGFVFHSDPSLDHEDCYFYSAGSDTELIRQDLLIDQYSLAGANISCRTVKHTIFAGMVFSKRYATLQQLYLYAAEPALENAVQTAALSTLVAQSQVLFPDQSKFLEPTKLEDLKNNALQLTWSGSDDTQSITVDAFDSAVVYYPAGGVIASVPWTTFRLSPESTVLDQNLFTSTSAGDLGGANIVALGVEETNLFITETRNIRINDISIQFDSTFSARNYWSLVANQGVDRDDLPKFLFSPG